jgi:hypothetical protein
MIMEKSQGVSHDDSEIDPIIEGTDSLGLTNISSGKFKDKLLAVIFLCAGIAQLESEATLTTGIPLASSFRPPRG